MSSSVPWCHGLFCSVDPGGSGDDFVDEDGSSGEGEVGLDVTLAEREVGNVAVVMSSLHDETESGCGSRDKYFCDSEMFDECRG